MGLRRMLGEARDGIRAGRRRRAAAGAPGEIDARLDDIDQRLSQTVHQLADRLDERAVLLSEQRRQMRRNGHGSGNASAAGA